MVRENQLSIVHHWHRGVRNCKVISKATGIPLRTVQYNVRLLQNKYKLPISTDAGRAPKLNARWSRSLTRLLQYHWKERKPLRWYITELERRGGPKISDRTLRTFLAKFGCRYVLRSPRRPLTEPQRKNRLKWCIDHLRDCWSSTLFDECTFQLGRQSERTWVSWRHLMEARNTQAWQT
jgi:hypothetical protein